MDRGPKVHFNGLDAVRGLAALGVFAFHVEQLRALVGLPSLLNWPPMAWLGESGVRVFFTLSGFLITYLLLDEEARSGLSIRQFYTRRALRILPLYYLLSLFGLFLAPSFDQWHSPVGDTLRLYNQAFHAHFGLNVALYLTVLSNFCLLRLSPVWFATQTWSIAYEEQFYLSWPWIIRRRIHPALLGWLLLGIALLKTAFGLWVAPWILASGWAGPATRLAVDYLRLFPIECLSLGAAAAVLLFRRGRSGLEGRLAFPLVQRLALVILAVSLFVPSPTGSLRSFFLSLLHAFLILSLAAFPARAIGDNPVTAYLGRISYGLYMYNPFAIMLALQLLYTLRTWIRADHFGSFSAALYALALALTWGMAALSYRFFESPILGLKRYFRSGETATAPRAAGLVEGR